MSDNEDSSRKQIDISVKLSEGGDDQELHFKVKGTTKIGKVLANFKKNKGLGDDIRLRFNGIELQDEDASLNSLGIKADDVIDAYRKVGASADKQKDADKEGENNDSEFIRIVVDDAHNKQKIDYQLKLDAKFGKFIAKFHHSRNLEPNTYKFFAENGDRIQELDTPKSLGLQDGDLIAAMTTQHGGR